MRIISITHVIENLRLKIVHHSSKARVDEVSWTQGWNKVHLAKKNKRFSSTVNFQIHCRHKQAVLWSDAILTLWTCSYSALTSYSFFTEDYSHLTCQVHTSHSKRRYNFPTHPKIPRFSLQAAISLKLTEQSKHFSPAYHKIEHPDEDLGPEVHWMGLRRIPSSGGMLSHWAEFHYPLITWAHWAEVLRPGSFGRLCGNPI